MKCEKKKKEKFEDWGKDPNLETESRYQSTKFGSKMKPRKKPLNQILSVKFPPAEYNTKDIYWSWAVKE